LSSPQQILKKYWQHDNFRGNQAEIIDAVLNKRDVLALLPTGGGKSICFQVPAMLVDGVCIVISPLIALMKDQVENLINKGIPAVFLHGGLTQTEVQDVLEEVIAGEYKFLYLSPERLETNLFRAYLIQLNCCLIAVDEAHCVSQWGYDFRQPYLRIANIKYELKQVPMIALTASATPLVQEDIVDKLKLRNAVVFRQSFERANLSYSVFKVGSKISKAAEILKNVPGCSIIYCRSRNQTREIANLLQLQNIAADYYHAGLSQEERNGKQQAWVNNKIRVIVCTNAFGMGIDKPDVRTVMHFDVPDCVESYYQEAGRAGRDGKKSYAVLLYDDYEIVKLEAMPNVRFPSFDEIKKVYQALADYLNIPVGSGEGMFYDFDISTFAKNFKFKTQLVLATLGVLQQEGHLAFNENVFLPTRVMFTAQKAVLEDFEFAHPQLDIVVKCLLRSYAGVYDNYTSISEKQIARKLRMTEAMVEEKLIQLRSFGIISFFPRKETPQIQLLLNRAPANYLIINHQTYAERKRLYKERVDKMLAYISLTNQCRGQFIAFYFGDKEAKPCGICDTCLNKKKKNTSTNEVDIIQIAVFDYLQKGGGR
jgi:ATP-dependent DNA helicase RecQ